MRIDLPISGAVGKGRSLNSNPGESHNCFVTVNSAGETRLTRRAGQKLAFTLPNSPVRGCYSDSDTSYWVAGNGVYKLATEGTVTLLGTIATNSGRVSFASSGIDLMLVDGNAGWSVKLATDVMVQITDVSFPAMPVDVIYLHGFFVVTVKDQQRFYVSEELNIATAWNGLDFATAEGNPDNIIAPIILNNELLLFGFKTVEVWSFTGNTDFPLQPNPNVTISHGCIAGGSVSRAGDSVYWLGGDDLGHGIVYRMNGYQAERVSLFEIDEQIAQMLFIKDAFAVSYQMDGHVFYVLQFPSENVSIYYNISTGLWGNFSHQNQLTGDRELWRASCHCFSAANNLVGSTVSGEVYQLRNDIYTDNGDEIVMERTGMVSKQEQKMMFYSEVIVDMETGVGNNLAPGNDPKIGLQWSDDAGHTWSNWRFMTIGKIGEYGQRAYFDMLGEGRNRVWKIRVTDPVKAVVLGAVINVEVGTS